MNLLRVWGGGIYETEDFYDLCDELGVLVWQDFLLACAAYAEEQPLWGEFEAEARQAVARLAKHPSLVIWNGGNENIWGYVEWNWRAPLAGRTWGDGYYTELFPSIVAELDPRAPYSPGSPFSYAKYHHPNDHRHGTMHIWDVWNHVDYRHYRDYPARFVSELGFQGPPAWSTLDLGRARRADGPVRRADAGAPEGDRRQPQAGAGYRRPPADVADRARSTSTTGTGRPSSTRPAPSATASRTSAASTRSTAARWCGSSTTTGR